MCLKNKINSLPTIIITEPKEPPTESNSIPVSIDERYLSPVFEQWAAIYSTDVSDISLKNITKSKFDYERYDHYERHDQDNTLLEQYEQMTHPLGTIEKEKDYYNHLGNCDIYDYYDEEEEGEEEGEGERRRRHTMYNEFSRYEDYENIINQKINDTYYENQSKQDYYYDQYANYTYNSCHYNYNGEMDSIYSQDYYDDDYEYRRYIRDTRLNFLKHEYDNRDVILLHENEGGIEEIDPMNEDEEEEGDESELLNGVVPSKPLAITINQTKRLAFDLLANAVNRRRQVTSDFESSDNEFDGLNKENETKKQSGFADLLNKATHKRKAIQESIFSGNGHENDEEKTPVIKTSDEDIPFDMECDDFVVDITDPIKINRNRNGIDDDDDEIYLQQQQSQDKIDGKNQDNKNSSETDLKKKSSSSTEKTKRAKKRSYSFTCSNRYSFEDFSLFDYSDFDKYFSKSLNTEYLASLKKPIENSININKSIIKEDCNNLLSSLLAGDENKTKEAKKRQRSYSSLTQKDLEKISKKGRVSIRDPMGSEYNKRINSDTFFITSSLASTTNPLYSTSPIEIDASVWETNLEDSTDYSLPLISSSIPNLPSFSSYNSNSLSESPTSIYSLSSFHNFRPMPSSSSTFLECI